ncbi:MAG: C-terminal helicase domain-containing protein, partial [Candidatus Nanoarchaeia archaeon]|nr:C-terminal helicase domain-containing protein [Candidatus Nanoarchaeia archaeon]
VLFRSKNLRANRINAVAIHGGLSQNKRTNTLGLFNDAKVEILVCTDVAARGLHIDNVSHIYNYDLPRDPNDYIHRIGRTARAGEEGKVVNLLSSDGYESFSRIQRDYSFSVEKKQRPFLKQIVVSRETQERRMHQRPRWAHR